MSKDNADMTALQMATLDELLIEMATRCSAVSIAFAPLAEPGLNRVTHHGPLTECYGLAVLQRLRLSQEMQKALKDT